MSVDDARGQGPVLGFDGVVERLHGTVLPELVVRQGRQLLADTTSRAGG